MFTEAIDNYLKAIYALEARSKRVATSELARCLAVRPASATGMLKRLRKLGLVIHRRYQGARLTETGRMRALLVIRRHRLVETFLFEKLDVPLEDVHQEADKWEHILSEPVTERLDAWLGHPATDPHGSPIPTSDGKIVLHCHRPLKELEPGQVAIVAEVSDHDPVLLRHLRQMKLLPKATVRVVARQSGHGSLVIRIGGRKHSILPETAEHVFVRLLEVHESAPGTELPFD